MLPDFNRLKVFYYVYHRQSVAAAAKDLNITQSGVSQQLQKLEAELKTPLFTRLHKKLVPTLAGDRLFTLVGPFVEELEIGVSNIRQAQEKPSGPLRIGAPVEFGKEYFPGLFASFRREYPEVVFFLQLGDPAVLCNMLAAGELDFAFADMFYTEGPFVDRQGLFSVEPVIEEEIILACSREYYENRIAGNHSYEHLRTLEFLSYQQNALALKTWFRHHFGKTPPHMNIVMAVDSLQAIISGLRSHLGLGIIASHLAWTQISRGDLVPITTPKGEVLNLISLVLLQDKIPTLTEKTFLAHFRREIHLTGIQKNFTRIARTPPK